MVRNSLFVFVVFLVSTITPCSLLPRVFCQEINVSGTKEFLIIHEEPEKYVGKTIVVPAQLGWLNPTSLNRKNSVDGYIFSFDFGQTLKGAKSFGNRFTLIPKEMNYVMPSNQGRDIIANWKTSGLTYHRVKITFKVVKMKIKDPIEGDYYLAIVQSISK